MGEDEHQLEQTMPIHSLYAGPEAFIFDSTGYINDEHTCFVSRYLITSFIQL